MMIGISRGSFVWQDNSVYYQVVGREITLAGIVAEDPSTSPSGQKRLKLVKSKTGDQNLPGEIWISLASNDEIRRSDRVVVQGQLSKGFGSFEASMYSAKIEHIYKYSNNDTALNIRDWFSQKVRLAVSEPQASLGLGFLTGQRSELPEELMKSFQVLGLTHIIVASGYNLTILVRLTRKLLARFSKYLATISALGLTVAFLAITGLSPSMTRASIITTLSLLAWYFGRSIHPVVLLCFVAGLSAYISPGFVWGDLGWYLSFAAFSGVIMLAPLISAYFWGNEKPGFIMRIVVETLSAQIMTVPIIGLAFGQIATLSILSNVLILPLVPFAMLATFIAGIGSAILPFMAGIFGWPASILLHYMTGVSDYLSKIPLSSQEINFRVIMLTAYYLFVIGVIIYLKRATKHKFIEDNIVV